MGHIVSAIWVNCTPASTIGQGHRSRRNELGHNETRSGDGPYRTRRPSLTPCPAPAPFARDRRDGTRSGTGSFRPRHALPHAIRHRLLSPATGHTGRCDRRRTIRDAMIISCPTMPGNVRKCPEMSGNVRKCPDDGRLVPTMSDEPGLSGNRFTGCERPNDCA